MVIFPIDVSRRTRFHDSADIVSIVVDSACGVTVITGVDVTVPVFDWIFTVSLCCWVHPAENNSAAMSNPVRMNTRNADIGIRLAVKENRDYGAFIPRHSARDFLISIFAFHSVDKESTESYEHRENSRDQNKPTL